MRITRLISLYAEECWAIEPAFFAAGQRLLWRAFMGQKFSGEEIHAALDVPVPSDGEQQAKTEQAAKVRIGIVPIQGVIEDHTQSMGTSARQIDAILTKAVNDRSIDAILLDIQSPGGVVTGVPELAAKITAAAKAKPMLAFNAGMMASAAYWLGSAAGQVMATQSALTGSIGVFTWHEDLSGFLEKEGITITEISAGKFKTEMAPWKPLTEEAKAAQQRVVDQVYAGFVKDVAAARGTTQAEVRGGYGQGRVLSAPDALKANLIDSVGTFEDALATLAARAGKKRARGARADSLRREMRLR